MGLKFNVDLILKVCYIKKEIDKLNFNKLKFFFFVRVYLRKIKDKLWSKKIYFLNLYMIDEFYLEYIKYY